MVSLPDALGDKCPPDFKPLWETCMRADPEDEAPWLVLADAADEWGMHGLAAWIRSPEADLDMIGEDGIYWHGEPLVNYPLEAVLQVLVDGRMDERYWRFYAGPRQKLPVEFYDPIRRAILFRRLSQ